MLSSSGDIALFGLTHEGLDIAGDGEEFIDRNIWPTRERPPIALQ